MWSLGKVLDTPEVARVYVGAWGEVAGDLMDLMFNKIRYLGVAGDFGRWCGDSDRKNKFFR